MGIDPATSYMIQDGFLFRGTHLSILELPITESYLQLRPTFLNLWQHQINMTGEIRLMTLLTLASLQSDVAFRSEILSVDMTDPFPSAHGSTR